MLPKSINCFDWFRDPSPYRDLFGFLGPYWVSIYISGSLFSVFWLHSREECLIQSTCIQQWVILICLWWVMTCTVIIHICCEVMLHTLALLPNFDFYLCLRVKFHKSLFWVPILAAGGPYWVPISQKNGSLLGPYLKAWGSLLVWESVEQRSTTFWKLGTPLEGR